MKKEKIIRNILIILTFIGLSINVLLHTNQVYSCTQDTMMLNSILISTPFTILIYSDYILSWVFGIWYGVLSIKSKKERIIKLSFCIISILITIDWLITYYIVKIFNIA